VANVYKTVVINDLQTQSFNFFHKTVDSIISFEKQTHMFLMFHSRPPMAITEAHWSVNFTLTTRF